MAADQVPAKNMGVYENFFGRKVYTTNLIPSLHSKTKAPIVSVAIHSDNLTNQLYIRYGSKSTYKEKSQYNAKTMNKEIENIININPEDYNWEYKRFKNRKLKTRLFINSYLLQKAGINTTRNVKISSLPNIMAKESNSFVVEGIFA